MLVFRRRGWAAADYDRWGADLRASGTAFVIPTTVGGETVARLALVNPRTTLDDVQVVLDAMAELTAPSDGGPLPFKIWAEWSILRT